MKKIHIGVDCDSVLYPFTEQFTKYCETVLGRELPEPWKFSMPECWNITEEQWWELYSSFVDEGLFLIGEPYPNINWAMTHLKKEGHTVSIITHRTYSNWNKHTRQKSIETTVQWLEKYGIFYDNLLFLKEKNLMQVDVLLDDALHNLENVSASTIPICISRNWNKSWEGLRADSVADALPIIKKMFSSDL